MPRRSIQPDGDRVTVERTQTGGRIEKRGLKVLKAVAEDHDISLGDLLEGIVFLAIGIGGIEFIAAVMLLRVALTTVAVVLLLGTIVAAIAIHIALGQYTFFHLLYAAAALIAVATYSREQRSV